jgi:hypothetical protein
MISIRRDGIRKVMFSAILLMLVAVFSSICACSDVSSTIANNSSHSILISYNSLPLQEISPIEMASLTSVTIDARGIDQEGPTLKSILNYVGISNFSKVTVLGYTKDRSDLVSFIIDISELGDNVILSNSDYGNFSLYSPNMEARNRIVDITEVFVEPPENCR